MNNLCLINESNAWRYIAKFDEEINLRNGL